MHAIFIVIAPVKAGEVGLVREQLAGCAYLYPDCAHDPFGFDQIENLHFASLFIYDDPNEGSFLCLEANVDGEAARFLEQLAGGRVEFLTELFAHCQGFTERSDRGLVAYWTERLHRPQAAHVAGFNLSRPRILADAEVRRVVESVLGDGRVKLAPDAATARVLEALESDALTSGKWDLIDDPGFEIGVLRRRFLWLQLGVTLIAYIPLAFFVLFFERSARQDEERPDLPLVASQKANEDLIPTNHMVSVVHLHSSTRKPGENRFDGWLRWIGAVSRRLTKRVAFFLLQTLAAMAFREGRLGSIGSIHFAHWAMANHDRRLVFVSNFGGSWDSYLDDFTLKASRGLTLAWGHGVGFPKSWFSIFSGAAQGPEFIDWARRSMVPTLVWYHGYPQLSASRVVTNRKLRQALQQLKASGGKDATWLKHV